MQCLQRFLVIAAIPAACPVFSFAQGTADYPNKSVRVIVAAAAGGASDILARMFTQKMSDSLKRQFVVDNRSGGGGIPAYDLVAKAAPDGYTLLLTSGAFTYGPALYPEFPDPVKAYAPISLATKAPYLLVATPALAANSVKELIALARSKPGVLNMGVTNAGFTHVATAYFAAAANINITVVPYKGSGQIMIDLIASRLDTVFANVLSTLPHVKSGRLRALAVSTTERSSVMPELPTVSESGIAGYSISSWFGWMAPARTPAVIVNKLSAELAKAGKYPDIVKNVAEDGGESIGSTPEQFQKFIVSEVPRWRKVVRDSGMRVD
jgi:tripartite-type tricarboxylate transporter receptor subunit TctC